MSKKLSESKKQKLIKALEIAIDKKERLFYLLAENGIDRMSIGLLSHELVESYDKVEKLILND